MAASSPDHFIHKALQLHGIRCGMGGCHFLASDPVPDGGDESGYKPGILEKGLLLRLRFELDQYINLRPIKLYPGVWTPLKDKGPDDIDFIVVRENTEGLYVGIGGFFKKGTKDEG